MALHVASIKVKPTALGRTVDLGPLGRVHLRPGSVLHVAEDQLPEVEGILRKLKLPGVDLVKVGQVFRAVETVVEVAEDVVDAVGKIGGKRRRRKSTIVEDLGEDVDPPTAPEVAPEVAPEGE